MPDLEKAGMLFVGHDDKAERMEIMELPGAFQGAPPSHSAHHAHPHPTLKNVWAR